MKKAGNLKKYASMTLQIFLSVLIVISLALPGLYQSVKIVLWIPILVSAWILRKDIKLSKSAAIWLLIYTAINLIFMIYGYFNGSADVFKYYTIVYLLAPWVYYFVLINPIQIVDNKVIDKALSFSFYLINTVIFISISLFKLGLLPEIVNVKDIGMLIIYAGGYMNYSIPAITSLFFLIPYFVSKTLLVIMSKQTDRITVVNVIFLVISFINNIMFGRRMLMIIFLISGLIVLALYYFMSGKVSKKMILVPAGIIVSFVTFYLLSNIFDWEIRFTADFFTSGNNERISQIQALISDWLKSPIVGHGIGINTSVIRSEIPGMYEMSYFAILFQSGIIGFAVKVVLFFWVGIKLYKASLSLVAQNQTIDFIFVLSILVAYISLMIANSTNPYLDSYDCLLFLMLPLATACRSIGGKR